MSINLGISMGIEKTELDHRCKVDLKSIAAMEPVLDVELVSHSFARCLIEKNCSVNEMICAANFLLDHALELLREKES